VQRRSINLTFHGIGDRPRPLEAGEAAVWVSRARWLSILDSVTERHDVRITFDDGNKSDIVHALPALSERRLSATFFVVAGRLGEHGFLDRDDVRELAAAGMRIGSHGMRHRRWRGLDESALSEELIQAKAVLEELVERPVTEAACPFGAYDRRVLRTLRRNGYRCVYTSDGGTAGADKFVQARNSVRADDDPDLLSKIVSLDRRPHRAAPRRLKLAVKRWR
jgi:peptidoglycan/xylan/chitin deacetylase (PgdA/CDA1 family)